MMKTKLVVFDLDGTLNQTDLYSVPAHQKALAEYGITDKTTEEIAVTFGMRSQEYVPLLIGPRDAAVQRDYLDKVSLYEEQFLVENGNCFEGIREMLCALKEKGYQTAVCSNASLRYITLVLNALHINHLIDFTQELLHDMTKVQTLQVLLTRLSPSAAVMVGDRCYDLEAARGNNIPFIGCLYGFNPEEMQTADRKVESAAQIVAAVDSLIG